MHEKSLGPVWINDMQTHPPHLKNGHIYIKDVQCAETVYIIKNRFSDFKFWVMIDFVLKMLGISKRKPKL